MTTPEVLITAAFDDDAHARLSEFASVTRLPAVMSGEPLHTRDVDHLLAAADVIVAELDVVDEETLRRAPRLKLVISCRAKPANVDIAACSRRGIPVVTTPGRNAEATADFSFSLILSTIRKASQAERWMRSGEWTADRPFEPYERFRSFQLKDSVLGVLGGGAVGRRVVQRARGFGMRVKVYDPYLPADAFGTAAELVSLDEAMSTADVVTVHIPLTPQTTGVIGARELAMMKPTAYLVNAGRADIIDRDALMDVLRQRRIAGAGFDVFYHEPLPADDELFTMEHVTLTPHIAGASDGVISEHSRMAVEALEAFVSDAALPSVYNRQALAERE